METGQCVHCGLCLSSCPTYIETGLEAESPRGRVYLLAALREDPALLNPEVMTSLDDCLDCRACEEVCPAHVPTGHLVEEWRADLSRTSPQQEVEAFRTFRRLSRPLTFFLGSSRGLRWFQRLVRWSQSPLAGGAMRRLKVVPKAADALARGLPARVPHYLSRERKGRRVRSQGDRVMLFVGCVMDTVYAATNHHTADLLEMAGAEVVIPSDQRCCGALHMHGGQPDVTRRWARHNIEVFEKSGTSSIVVNAAGCGALLKEYPDMFSDDRAWQERAERFRDAVVDATVFLARRPLPEITTGQGVVSVHDPCHLAHAQGIRQEPREVLKRAGYTILEMPDADRCCGSAGIYNLTHPEMAARLLERKVADVPLGIDALAAANPGCMLQIQSGLRQGQRPVPVVHPVDLLWEAYHAAGLVDEADPAG